ncbi:hypothetical protein [Pseudonocardia zijingensis]|uniref:Tetratricopeptide repeat protein n=1 Tax=Pseudonocardia zijingensis TaxID=153376 RepID=A0ABP3Z193_9PSEU
MSPSRLLRQASVPPFLVIGMVVAGLFAAGVGIAVLVGGVDGTPTWMRHTAVALAAGLGIGLIRATTEWALDRRSVRRVCRYVETGCFLDAAVELQGYVKQLETLCGQYDPLTLRWSCTLAHLLLHKGQRVRAMVLLALVIDGQLTVLGPHHPDTQRSIRLLDGHTDITAPIAPVERWWA